MKILEIVSIKQETKNVGNRLHIDGITNDKRRVVIKSPDDGAKLAQYFIGDYAKEAFFVAMLNTKNQVNAVHICHVGSLNASIVHPREVFAPALLNNSASILVFHQHPSGDPFPSREDIEVTKRLVEAGKILGIEVLDHVILGEDSFISLKEKGYI
jgi:DNA repair protein RadC